MSELQLKDETHYLSQKELHEFHERGFFGPFQVYPADEVERNWRKAKFDLALSKKKPHDSEVINYDRHLDVQFLSDHVCRSEIVHKLISLMGRNILCWRTEMFPKYPGEEGTGWHQVQTYQVGNIKKGALKFTETNPEYMNELTVWTAFTKSSIEEGCLKFIDGSNKRWYYDEAGKLEYQEDSKRHNFFGYDYSELRLNKDWNPDQEKFTSLEMQPGQAVIFTAMCVHGSHANTSNRMRMGFAARYVRPSVKIYEGIDSLNQYGGSISLDYWGAVLVAGDDQFGYNKIHDTNFLGTAFSKHIGTEYG